MKKLLFLLLLPFSLFAQIHSRLPQEISPDSHVDDYVNALSPDQTRSLSEKLFFIERTYDVQIRIVLIKSLDGESIEYYSKTIGSVWHVGDHNGLVYVASLEDHKQRVEIADKLQQRISTDQAAEMTDAVKAHFKVGHYYEGLYSMLSVLQLSLETPNMASNKNELWYTFGIAGLILAFIIGLTAYIRKKQRDKAITDYYSPELSTDSDHTPYPHRLKQQANSRIHRQGYSSKEAAQYDTEPIPDNTLTNLLIMEQIIDSNNNNNIPSYDPGSSSTPDTSSLNDYSSSSYDSSSSSSGSDYSSSSDSSSSSGFDGGGGSSSDF